jgi:aminomethyltransferase
MLALQGPSAEMILQRLTPADLSAVAARTAVETTLKGVPALMGRTGYTGEDGFELYFLASEAVTLWSAILDAGKDDGLLACGLAARDSLRFEACLPLYGHELDASTLALEARMNWTIAWEKEFVGRGALLKHRLEGAPRLLVGFEMVDKAVAREHYVVAREGEEVGYVTSGMKSPTLDKFLGMAYVPAALSKLGTEIDILVRGQPKRAIIVKRPFYKPRYK